VIARSVLAALALAVLCSAADAQSFYCRLWPREASCQPAPTPPVVTPLPSERPAVTQPAPPVAPKAKAVRVKPKYTPAPKAKRKAYARRTVAWWCGLVSKGNTVEQIQNAARGYGRTVSRADAEACLASK
jgi:hypothetical protein